MRALDRPSTGNNLDNSSPEFLYRIPAKKATDTDGFSTLEVSFAELA